MKTIKPYLFIALAMLCSFASAQSNITINGRTYTLTRNPLAFEDFRVRTQFNLPPVLRSTADVSAVAFFNNRAHIRKMVDGVETWVPLVDSTTSVSSDVIDVYQYASNTDVTIGDTTTTLVLNRDGANTSNRTITLKSPVTFKGKSLKILNYNTGSYLNMVTPIIKYYDNSEITSLSNATTYLLSSDGSYWRLVSETKFIEGGSSPGGSSGVDLINLD